MANEVANLKKFPLPVNAVEVTLLTFAGAKLSASVVGTPVKTLGPNGQSQLNIPNDHIYAGKLWSINHQFSERAKHPVYIEVNQVVIAELRHNAQTTIGIADRWAAQLQALDIGVQ